MPSAGELRRTLRPAGRRPPALPSVDAAVRRRPCRHDVCRDAAAASVAPRAALGPRADRDAAQVHHPDRGRPALRPGLRPPPDQRPDRREQQRQGGQVGDEPGDHQQHTGHDGEEPAGDGVVGDLPRPGRLVDRAPSPPGRRARSAPGPARSRRGAAAGSSPRRSRSPRSAGSAISRKSEQQHRHAHGSTRGRPESLPNWLGVVCVPAGATRTAGEGRDPLPSRSISHYRSIDQIQSPSCREQPR